MAKHTFEQFMKQVDNELEKLCGMPSDMIDDWNYHDDYEADESPDTTAYNALENAANSIGFDVDEIIAGHGIERQHE